MGITTAVHVTARGKQQVGAESPSRFQEMFLTSLRIATPELRHSLRQARGAAKRRDREK